MFIYNGSEIDITRMQVIGDNQYPPVWLADPAARAELGIIEVDGAPPAVGANQRAAVREIVRNDDDGWAVIWDVVDMTPEEIAARDAALAAEQAARVPQKVTRRQARQALLLAGLLDAVQPAIDAISDPVRRRLAQIEWDDSLEFDRHHPLVKSIGVALVLDDVALDTLFLQAAAL
ncbi:hypothetical protein GTP38_23365 [Duganella sp. FT94W]|uniref:Phage tail protein n=1 Tax=Duganella lactea TaxID=2692173 RepID=A0ABW9VEZ4_9BURK|nr:hypothetical protein [Duganella lactea]MYM37270.1 hypothetical protein [Duganella lactea]